MAKYKVQNLQKAFTLNGKPHKVIRGLDLAVDSEEITVILGRSGCGKTTLLKVLYGLEPADAGLLDMPGMDKLGMYSRSPGSCPG